MIMNKKVENLGALVGINEGLINNCESSFNEIVINKGENIAGMIGKQMNGGITKNSSSYSNKITILIPDSTNRNIAGLMGINLGEIGRASWRERV